MLNWLRFIAFVFMLSVTLSPHVLASFSQKLDLQTRVDKRSDRDVRYQYRARYYPEFSFDSEWSVHAFAVTGDDFGSSHNTFDDSQADYFYVRRLFARHQGDYGKTEMGVIPTYKGRVSSSGLSKDGWITGLRHVRQLNNSSQFEVVLGQLEGLDPAHALDPPDAIDYVEIEYSARMDKRSSYEFSLERMTQANFIRAEFRYKVQPEHTMFAEVVKRAENSQAKWVLGIEGEFALAQQQVEYFAHYSYVSPEFGLRAELTEDFLGDGHGMSSELSADIGQSGFGWFVRLDLVEGRSRVLAGLSWSFKS
ncbi:hypothetical protein [Alteromonas facilis]|uniref:hypothetical protein n=1 Tax=Alteromonas facilis TaxID=2048004 RepID=UPI000C292FA7|nr:hypothetical protein [Alteromonas facilis]